MCDASPVASFFIGKAFWRDNLPVGCFICGYTLYADIDDLCEVPVPDAAGSEYPAELTGMIVWHAH